MIYSSESQLFEFLASSSASFANGRDSCSLLITTQEDQRAHSWGKAAWILAALHDQGSTREHFVDSDLRLREPIHPISIHVMQQAAIRTG